MEENVSLEVEKSIEKLHFLRMNGKVSESEREREKISREWKLRIEKVEWKAQGIVVCQSEIAIIENRPNAKRKDVSILFPVLSCCCCCSLPLHFISLIKFIMCVLNWWKEKRKKKKEWMKLSCVWHLPEANKRERKWVKKLFFHLKIPRTDVKNTSVVKKKREKKLLNFKESAFVHWCQSGCLYTIWLKMVNFTSSSSATIKRKIKLIVIYVPQKYDRTIWRVSVYNCVISAKKNC
jgi:hypothetical protein